MLRHLATVLVLMLSPLAVLASEPEDPFLWLEDVEGDTPLTWVKEHNARSVPELEAVPEFKPIFERTLEILDSEARIPTPTLRGTMVYNFWKDKTHERGILRRTSLASYRTPSPEWETVLDVDALAAAEGVPWVFKESPCLPPEHRRCLVSLARGGSDATVIREFDTVEEAFVEGGFALEEAKSFVAWRDEDSIWVGTDFGEGSMTSSGYPRIVKVWKRGEPLAAARTVFEGELDDVGVMGSTQFTSEGRYDLVVRIPAFFRQYSYLVLGDRMVKLDLPEDVDLKGFFKDHMLFALRSDWSVGGTTYPQGALVAADLDGFLAGERRFDVLFEPSERVSLDGVSTTRDRLLISTLDNVRSALSSVELVDGSWKRKPIALPGLGTAEVATATDDSNVFFFSYQDFLTPSSLYVVDDGGPAKVKAMPAFFAADGMAVRQLEAWSKDGTKIPYFLVTPPGFDADGTAPALLYGYGGFEVSEVPRYNAVLGSAWLARGGVYALATLRGGGEFGPRWHEAALKEKRIKSFEDFIAVAEDLIARKVTSPAHLGIMGGSQGGLLVGGAFTMRPELFGAVVSQVPLADMRRFSVLLAGASWMGEYGNPDIPEQWSYIKTWSPYHLLRRDAKYPKPFYWTNTRDDRVHPGHARKMVAKMEALGHPVYYFENTEGGHGSGSVNSQTAKIDALEYAYLWKMLR